MKMSRDSENMLDILVFGAHPDDAEIGMGATIAKHSQAGLRVGICDLTQAEMSSNGTPLERQQEAAVAAELLGVRARFNLNLPDRGLFVEATQIEAITAMIRQTKPRIVFAPYWIDRHPDHIACSKLVEEAVFNAKLRKFLPSTEPVQVEQLYFYFIHEWPQPNVIIDVSDVHSLKMKALEAYSSQFTNSDRHTVKTPLNQGYLSQIEARDRLLGQTYQFAYAEGFIKKTAQVHTLLL
jgi:bacillithiol biosynthesis deacetylase BshB1